MRLVCLGDPGVKRLRCPKSEGAVELLAWGFDEGCGTLRHGVTRWCHDPVLAVLRRGLAAECI